MGILRKYPLSWLSVTVTLAALVFGAIVWSKGGFTPEGYRAVLTDGFMMALIAGIAVGVFFLNRDVLATDKESRVARLTWAAVGALLTFGLVWEFGRIQFGGHDHGAMIELGWRMIQGQTPTVDFPSTTPVGFVFGAYWAFRLFGVSWNAIVLWEALFAATSFIWLYLLLIRLGIRTDTAFLFATTWQAATNILVAYWWYNSTTSILALVYLLSSLCFWRRPGGSLEAASYVASLLLVACAKPNVAAPLIVGITIALLSSRPHRWRTLGYSAVALAAFVGGLALGGISLWGLVHSYWSIADRASTLNQFLQDLTPDEKVCSIVILCGAVFPLLFLRPWRCLGRHADTLIAISGIVAGLVGVLTNGELKLVDLPLLLAAGVWVASVRTDSSGTEPPASVPKAREDHGTEGHPRPAFGRWLGSRFSRALPAWVLGLSFSILIIGLVGGAVRERVRAIGTGAFFEYKVSSERIGEGFFKGMRASQTLGACERALSRWIAQHPDEPLFCGPRLVWSYAAFGLKSPVKCPPWWEAGVAFRREDEATYLSEWREQRFPTVMLLGYRNWKKGGRFLLDPDASFSFLPKAMTGDIDRDYETVPGYEPLIVFRRKAP